MAATLQNGCPELVPQKLSSRGERRKRDVHAAIRKKRITEQVYHIDGCPYYNNLHQFSKNKIHCSCWMCSAKSKPKSGGHNWSISDRRKIDQATFIS